MISFQQCSFSDGAMFQEFTPYPKWEMRLKPPEQKHGFQVISFEANPANGVIPRKRKYVVAIPLGAASRDAIIRLISFLVENNPSRREVPSLSQLS